MRGFRSRSTRFPFLLFSLRHTNQNTFKHWLQSRASLSHVALLRRYATATFLCPGRSVPASGAQGTKDAQRSTFTVVLSNLFLFAAGEKKKCNVAHERPITEKYIQFKLTRTLHNLQRKRFIITLHTRAFGSVTAAWIVRGLLASKERLSSRKTASATPTVETPFEIGRNAAELSTVCSLVSGSWAASADRPGTQVHRWISGVQFQLF